MEICSSERCTGCGACFHTCPFSAIEMVEDPIGHLIPKVDAQKCRQCGLCEKTCPANHPEDGIYPQTAYAAWSLDDGDRSSSSSGGAASVFSTKMLRLGGVVYGAAFADGKFQHIRVTESKDLPLLKGSKYVQSELGRSFALVLQDLQQGRRVLFVGTPCQTAGLRAFLRAKRISPEDENRLLTVDLVCHGTPPQRLLKEHLAPLLGSQEAVQITFRDGNSYAISVYDQDGRVRYSLPMEQDLFFLGFWYSLFCRSCCYTCHYAKPEHGSDITIGDFWGLGQAAPFEHDTQQGVSLLLPTSEKGEQWIQECRDLLFLEKRTVEEAVQGNTQLQRPSKKHRNTDRFVRFYSRMPIDKAVAKCLRREILRKWLGRVKRRLLKLLGR